MSPHQDLNEVFSESVILSDYSKIKMMARWFQITKAASHSHTGKCMFVRNLLQTTILNLVAQVQRVATILILGNNRQNGESLFLFFCRCRSGDPHCKLQSVAQHFVVL